MPSWIDIVSANDTAAWLTAASLFIGLLGAGVIIRYTFSTYLTTFVRSTKTSLDDFLLLIVQKTSLLLVALFCATVALKSMHLPEGLDSFLFSIGTTTIFIQIALWGNSAINFFLSESVQKTSNKSLNVSARRAIALVCRTLLLMLVVTLLLENLGVRLSPLLAGLGIGGIAVALAAQNILGDLFCYFSIILDQPFEAGDFIIVDDVMGTVERVGLKNTRVRSLSGELIILANTDLVSSRVKNYKTLAERRVAFTFGVTYGTSGELLRKIPDMVSSVLHPIENVRLDRVNLSTLGHYSLDFEVVYFVSSSDYNYFMSVQETINLQLIEAFRIAEIEFAFPTQRVLVSGVSSQKSAK
jgi:small-conductance mechanosensitive channel